jgi:hypothetical protein
MLKKLNLEIEFFPEIAKKLYKYSTGSSSMTLISPPGKGLGTLVQKLIRNLSQIDEKYSEYEKLTKFLWLDLDIENLEEAVKSLIGEINFEINHDISLKSRWKGVEMGMKSILEKDFERIVLIVNNAAALQNNASSLTSHLHHLTRILPGQLTYLFIVNEEISFNKIDENTFGKSYSYLKSNVVYTPSLKKGEMRKIAEDINRSGGNKLSEKTFENYIKFAGNFLRIFTALSREYLHQGDCFQSSQEALENEKIYSVLLNIWESFTADTQEKILNDKDYKNDYLLQTELVDGDGNWFSVLFEQFIENIKISSDKNSDQKSRDNASKIAEILSWQELTVYNLLKNERGKTVKREDIAKAIWKNEWLDRYSEWAIAQVISQIRRKTSAFDGICIKTIRGEGYRML